MEAKKKITAQPMWVATAEYGHYVKNEKDEGSSIFRNFDGSYDKVATDFGVMTILSTERTTKKGAYSAEIYERCETEEPFYYTKVRVYQKATDRTMDDSNIYDALFG